MCCDGPCDSAECACYNNKTICRPSCKCSISCERRFDHCLCVKSCDSSCPCAMNNIECQDTCRNGKCDKKGACFMAKFLTRRPARSYVAKSCIPGQLGLFCGQSTKRHSMVMSWSMKTRTSNSSRLPMVCIVLHLCAILTSS
jgi:hypothetical protein